MKARPLTGVNLGGWLVLEKWITPSLFHGTSAHDEYSFCKQADVAQLQRLKKFRDTFITKQDFEWLATQGIDAVRLPVGYWIFGNKPPYEPTNNYVDQAFQWAEETGIRILLGLHGAPGSQNGRDHSGRIGAVGWAHSASYIDETLEVIHKIAKRYGNRPALLGISLLNEPAASISKATLLEYYRKAYDIIRAVCGPDVWIVYSDAYKPTRWRKELPRRQFKNVYIDTHRYRIFSFADKIFPPLFSLLRTRFQLPRSLARLRKYHPVIVGEWSLTLGSHRLRQCSATDQRKTYQSYGQLQIKAYQTASAWFFWTYHTEAGGTWDFRECREKGLL